MSHERGIYMRNRLPSLNAGVAGDSGRGTEFRMFIYLNGVSIVLFVFPSFVSGMIRYVVRW